VGIDVGITWEYGNRTGFLRDLEESTDVPFTHVQGLGNFAAPKPPPTNALSNPTRGASFRLIVSVFRGFMGDTFTDQLGEDIFIDQRQSGSSGLTCPAHSGRIAPRCREPHPRCANARNESSRD